MLMTLSSCVLGRSKRAASVLEPLFGWRPYCIRRGGLLALDLLPARRVRLLAAELMQVFGEVAPVGCAEEFVDELDGNSAEGRRVPIGIVGFTGFEGHGCVDRCLAGGWLAADRWEGY